MLSYQKFVKRPSHLRRLTGLSVLEFEQLLDKFQSSWNMYLSKLAKNPKRQRKIGGRRHEVLETIEDKLLFILVYVRMYPLLFLQGIMFGIEEGNTCIWVHRLLPLLDEALGFAHKKPARKHRGRNLEELLRDFPELKELGILGDGVERTTRRPKDNEKQKNNINERKRGTHEKILFSQTRKQQKFCFYAQLRIGQCMIKKQ